MIKLRYIFALFLLVFSVFGLFQVKFKVQQLHREVNELRSQLEHEKDSIHVLKAEWSYLNQPERLTRLSKKFLELEKVKSDQVLPVKPGVFIHLVADKPKEEKLERNSLIKVSLHETKPKKKSVKWNYRQRPALKTRSTR